MTKTTMERFRFLQWEAYKDAKRLVSLIFHLVRKIPNETLAGIDVLRDNKFITNNEFSKVYRLLDSVSRQLGGFKKKLSAGHKS